MVSERELGWLEGFIDGEGSFGIYRGPDGFCVSGRISNTNVTALQRAREIVGAGTIRLNAKTSPSRNRPLFVLNLPYDAMRTLLPKMKLVIKEQHRLLVLEALSLLAVDRNPGRNGYTREKVDRLESLRLKIKEINLKGRRP